MKKSSSVKLTSVLSVAVSLCLAAAPFVYAAEDVAVESTLSNSSEASTSDIPQNPSQELPETVAENIPDNSTMVSEDLAADSQGNMYRVETGEKITDATLVGTPDTPPDPLAKTDGEKFIPVDIDEVKEKIEANNKQDLNKTNAAPSSVRGSRNSSVAARVRQAALPNNNYGAHWGTYNNTPAFFESNGNLFVQQAKGVIDVSEHQGNIDWNAVKSSGNVQGVIVRLGFGSGNRLDGKAARNVQEIKRLRIPFGVYWYSYSASASDSVEEGKSTVAALHRLGISPQDLSYPVYYDMERWTWTGHAPSTNPNVNADQMKAYFNTLSSAGYSNLAVYSYTSYLNTSLRHNDIWKRTTWVAQYGARMGFTAWNTNFRGWQYSSQGRVNGIQGNVDINAFGNHTFVGGDSAPTANVNNTGTYDVRHYPLVRIDNGEYYINSKITEKISVDFPAATTDNGAQIKIYSYNHSQAQRFRFTRNNDDSYTIANVKSGKVFDVNSAHAANGARVQQWDPNGSPAQRWFIRDSGYGYFLQSALGNWVLDINGARTHNGNIVQLYSPNLSDAQKFYLASVHGPTAGRIVKITTALNPSRVLDIAAASKQNFALAQTYEWNGTSAQLYTLKEVGNGTFAILNKNSNKALEVTNNRNNNGATISQYDFNNSQAQQWIVRRNGDGTFFFQGRGSGKFAEVPGANAFLGARLGIYEGNGTTAQRWRIAEVSQNELNAINFARRYANDLPDGTYEFVRPTNKSVALDLAGASQANSANVQLYTANQTIAQRWIVSHDSLGYVTLTNKASSKVLDVSGAVACNGQNMQQYQPNGTAAQKWVAVKNTDGTYTFHSKLNTNYVVDANGNRTSNFTNVQLYTSNKSTAQKWALHDDLANGQYTFARPQNTKVVMDLNAASHANGANIQIYKSNRTGAQQWLVKHVDGHYVAIYNRSSGKVLDVPGAVVCNGQNIHQWQWNGTAAQKWIAVRNNNGTYTFHSALNYSYVIDVHANSIGNFTNVHLWEENGSQAQQWNVAE